MSDERYRPGFMNEEEYRREQTRQKDMVDGIAREYSRAQEKEKALKRLSHLLKKLEKTEQDLVEITKALRNII